jgi:hypothetical protein
MTLLLDPLAWFGLALLVYAIVVNSPWQASLAAGGDHPAPFSLAGLLRLLYLLGPPLLAVGLRTIPADAMGLSLPAAGWRIGLGYLAVLLAAALLLALSLREPRAAAFLRSKRRAGSAPSESAPSAVEHIGRAGVDALLLESHWAFARAAALSVGLPHLGGDTPITNLGATMVLALLLLALEAALDPRQRAAWTLGDPRAARQGLLAATSMLLFAIGLSSIVAWLAHWLLRASLATPLTESASPDRPRSIRPPAPVEAPVVARPATPDTDIEPTIV